MLGIARTALPGHVASGVRASTANGAGRARVADIQRGRMLAAMAEVCAEHGAANVTVSLVVARAGVSRRTFYEIFADCEDCFLSAFDEAVARAAERVLPAYRAGDRWQEQIRAGLTALLRFLDEQPFMGRLLIVESLGAGSVALERRSKALAPVIAAIKQGGAGGQMGVGSAALAAEGLVGAVLTILHARMIEGASRPLAELASPLAAMIVLPYLGAAASRRELKRRVPEVRALNGGSSANLLKQLDVRLTYRTVQVLSAIASIPGASNRQVAEASGIADQGQISKLLARLKKLGLVANHGENGLRGGPNAWTLTEAGRNVHDTLTVQSGQAAG